MRVGPEQARSGGGSLALSALLVATLVGCTGDDGGDGSRDDAAPGAARFDDVTDASGIDFVTVCGGRDKDWVLEVNGAGVALLDYDGDGDLDVYFVNGSRLAPPYGAGPGAPPPSDALYRNLGDLRFEDVTAAAGLTESAWGCGVAAGDYDNDGDADLFVANYGPDTLWRNDGDGTFTDVTREAGVGDPEWGSSCAFLDYDRDGHLDIFVVNYLVFDPAQVRRRGDDPTCRYKGQLILCGPVGLPPAPCTLYRNRGDGAFEDVSVRSGIRSVEPSYGLGVVVLDVDRDDWLDVYVANDSRENLLFRNRGDGTFEEIGMRLGVGLNDQAIAQAGMGVDAPFLEGSDLEDLFVTNYEDDTNTYYRNQRGEYFSEETAPRGLAGACYKQLGWGVVFFDADLDADQDVFIAQGHVVPQADAIPSSPGYKQRNALFLSDGSGRFVDVSTEAGGGLALVKSSRGVAAGDLDGDGDIDLVVNEIDERATVLENHGPPRHHWLAVRVRGTMSNRDGIGAVVTLRAGGVTQRRRVRSGGSYASQSELLARFGLGEATAIEDLRVRWPTGVEERYAAAGVDRVLELVEGAGGARSE